MKNQSNNSVRATALQLTLSVAMLLGLAILFASSFKAATTAAPNQAPPVVVAQPGFFPPLPTSLDGPAPTCTPKEVDDKISSGDPKQLGRLNPGGVPSSCGGPPNGCSTTAGMFHYTAHSFVNDTGAARCVTARLSSSCTGANSIFAAAYADSFDPANICTNIIGDAGVIPNGSPVSFSFNVAAGATFVVVVAEVTANAGCAGYKVEIFGLCPSSPTPTPTPARGPCPLTQGFWKNHPSAWPVTTLTLGGTSYTQVQLLAILNTPVHGDASLNLAHQLIATLLSIAHGSDATPIASTVAHAQTLLTGCAIPCGVRASSTLGQQMTADASLLDAYNNGQLTPGCGATF